MDAITELIALIEELGTSVLSLPALAGIAVTAAVFALEIKWSRARPAAGGSKRRCASGTSSKQGGRHVGTTPPRPPSGPRRGIMRSIPTTSLADSTGIHIWNGHTRPPVIRLYYIDNPRRAFRGERKRSAAANVLFLLIPIAAGAGVMCLLHGCAAG